MRRDVESRYARGFANEVSLSPRTRLALNESLAWASAPRLVTTSTGRAEPDLAARFERETRGLVVPEHVAKIFAR